MLFYLVKLNKTSLRNSLIQIYLQALDFYSVKVTIASFITWLLSSIVLIMNQNYQ